MYEYGGVIPWLFLYIFFLNATGKKKKIVMQRRLSGAEEELSSASCSPASTGEFSSGRKISPPHT
jgi:hypothetical protein